MTVVVVVGAVAFGLVCVAWIVMGANRLARSAAGDALDERMEDAMERGLGGLPSLVGLIVFLLVALVFWPLVRAR